MNAEPFARKLTAILSADAIGYSRLMGDDDVETVRTLKQCRNMISTLVNDHGGRVVDSPGDNLLAEFPSVVDAVTCSLAIQEKLADYNQHLSPQRQMVFRIGIDLGEVIVDGKRIYGDGVNIAARLEGLAEAGGICISGTAYEQVRNKVRLGCEYIGEQSVKNISLPVPAYRIWNDAHADACRIKTRGTQRRPIRFPLVTAVLVILILTGVLLGGGLYFDLFDRRPGPRTLPDGNARKQASIAVLPFNSLSREPQQEYFSEGITNDIITDLSKFHELIVMSSHAVSAYEDKAVDIQKVSRELGVRYILEGSVQKSGNRVRVNVQLLDSERGHHLWADRFDRPFEDIFSVQEEILSAIIRELALSIDQAERSRAMRKPTSSLAAYDYLLRGYHHYYKRTRESNREARRLFNQAVKLDKDYAAAYVGLANTFIWDAMYGWTEFPNRSLERAHAYTLKALSIDPSDALAHSTLGYIHMRTEAYDQAIDELQTAIELNPNHWSSYRYLGAGMLYSGRTNEALELYTTAMQYDPYKTPGMFMNMGIMHYLKGDYKDALKWLQKGAGRYPSFLGIQIMLAATYARMDRIEDAQVAAEKVRRISPFFEVEFYGSVYRNPEDRAKITAGMYKAGLE
jgi:adenylate cyclase